MAGEAVCHLSIRSDPNKVAKRSDFSRVRTGPEKPGKSWNLIIWIQGLESHGI